MGADLPVLTQTLFSSFRFWFIAPIAFTAILIDISRRREPSLAYTAAAIGLSLATGFVLQGWATEGCFLPLFSLMRTLG